MTPELTHPGSASLLRELGSLFRSRRIFTSQDRRLVFLCGGPVPSRRFFRPKVLAYARTSLREFRFFLAEDAARDIFAHGEPTFVNIAEFEALISDLADCVLIIPESPGSIAELGYFSAQATIRDKLLVVNDLDFQGDESFLNLGPIELVNRYSRYRPIVQIDLRAKKPQFRPIVNRLRRYRFENRGHFEFRKYDELPVRHRLFVIFEFIYLFEKISYDAIELLMQSVFLDGASMRNEQKNNLQQLLSILCAGNYVRRVTDHDLLEPVKTARPFLDISKKDRNSLRLKLSDFERRISPRAARNKKRGAT